MCNQRVLLPFGITTSGNLPLPSAAAFNRPINSVASCKLMVASAIFAPHGRAWHPSADCRVMVNTFSTLYMFGSGILTEERLSRHRDALIAHLKPDTLLIDKLLIKARGQK